MIRFFETVEEAQEFARGYNLDRINDPELHATPLVVVDGPDGELRRHADGSSGIHAGLRTITDSAQRAA